MTMKVLERRGEEGGGGEIEEVEGEDSWEDIGKESK